MYPNRRVSSQPQLDSTDLTEWVVPITGQDTRYFGTGFAIHQDNQGIYILTCRHVIDEIGGPSNIQVNFQPARMVAHDDADGGFDLALLCVSNTSNIPILSPTTRVSTGISIQTAGFYTYGKQSLAQPLRGIVGSRQRILSHKRQCRSVAWRIELEKGHQIQRGYSGAPLLDEGGQVMGIVTYREGDGQRGLAISIEALVHIWSDMPSTLRENCKPHVPQSVRKHSDSNPLMNFENEIALFTEIASEIDMETRLVTITGKGGSGKTRLLDEFMLLAREHDLDTLQIALNQQISVEKCLDDIVYHWGLTHFPNYNAFRRIGRPEPLTREREEEWYANLTREFYTDLVTTPPNQRLCIFLDTYEKADALFKLWLVNRFLPGLKQQELVIVIAGQEPISRQPSGFGQQHFLLEGVSVDCYRRYTQDCGLNLPTTTLEIIHEVVNGRPKELVDYVQGQLAIGVPS